MARFWRDTVGLQMEGATGHLPQDISGNALAILKRLYLLLCEVGLQRFALTDHKPMHPGFHNNSTVLQAQ